MAGFSSETEARRSVCAIDQPSEEEDTQKKRFKSFADLAPSKPGRLCWGLDNTITRHLHSGHILRRASLILADQRLEPAERDSMKFFHFLSAFTLALRRNTSWSTVSLSCPGPCDPVAPVITTSASGAPQINRKTGLDLQPWIRAPHFLTYHVAIYITFPFLPRP